MSSIRLLIDNTTSADLAFARYSKVHQKINNLRAAGLGFLSNWGNRKRAFLLNLQILASARCCSHGNRK